MKKFNLLILLILIMFAFTSIGCWGDETQKANELINKANIAIEKYSKLENQDIASLSEKIEKSESSKQGAAKSLIHVKKILLKIDAQQVLLNNAKEDIYTINSLSINKQFKKYAILTRKALEADIEKTEVAKNLYLQLKIMYEAISQNSLSPAKYQNINNEVQDLTAKLENIAAKQEQLHSQKEHYYKTWDLGE